MREKAPSAGGDPRGTCERTVQIRARPHGVGGGPPRPGRRPRPAASITPSARGTPATVGEPLRGVPHRQAAASLLLGGASLSGGGRSQECGYESGTWTGFFYGAPPPRGSARVRSRSTATAVNTPVGQASPRRCLRKRPHKSQTCLEARSARALTLLSLRPTAQGGARTRWRGRAATGWRRGRPPTPPAAHRPRPLVGRGWTRCAYFFLPSIQRVRRHLPSHFRAWWRRALQRTVHCCREATLGTAPARAPVMARRPSAAAGKFRARVGCHRAMHGPRRPRA